MKTRVVYGMIFSMKTTQSLLAIFFVLFSSVVFTQAQESRNFESDIHAMEDLESRVALIGTEKSDSILDNYHDLKEVASEVKAIAPKFHGEVISDLKKGKPLHGSQLTLLHKIVGVFISLDYKLQKLAMTHSEEVFKVLPLLDRVENIYEVYLPFYKEKKFRRLVNAEDSSYQVERKELKKVILNLIKKAELKKIQKGYSDFVWKVKKGQIRRSAPMVTETIDHEGGKLIYDNKYWRGWRARLFGTTLTDFGSRIGSEIIHHASGAFGNGMGSIRWRRGWLDKDKKIEKEIFALLKPLDVITEKVGYTPTDFFIPGHFGHNAIWLGTQKQLEDLGLWNHPVIKPFQKDIAAGKSIIETDRSGTHFKSLADFMNVDEFGLLRMKRETLDILSEREKVLKIYEVAFAQLGKTYDFNFDVETTDQLVCSELLYQSFGDVNWPTEAYLGRTTISPDNVVSLALFDNAPIDLIYFIKGSKEGTYTYKDIDDLANDIGFVKKDGVYKEPYKVCKNVRVRKPGGRGHETINKRECETRLKDLIYVPHRSLPDFSF